MRGEAGCVRAEGIGIWGYWRKWTGRSGETNRDFGFYDCKNSERRAATTKASQLITPPMMVGVDDAGDSDSGRSMDKGGLWD